MKQKQLVISLLHEKTGNIKLKYVEIYHNILLYVEVLISTIHVDNLCNFVHKRNACADPEGGTPPPLETHKVIGFFSNTKLPSQHIMVLGNHIPTSKTPFKWCFIGGP